MGEKILLTGATGFLGSHLLKRLLEEGYDIVVTLRENSKCDRITDLSGFTSFTINKDFSNLNRLFENHNITTIIHTATEYGRNLPYSDVIISNFIFPIKLIEASQQFRLKYFINTDTFFSKFPTYTYLNEYTSTKKYFREYLNNLSYLNVVNLYLEHVFGENDSKDKFISSMIVKMQNNEYEIDLSSCEQKRDFIYVDDVVDAYLTVLIAKSTLPQRISFEVGSGISLTIKSLVTELHKKIKSKSNLNFGKIPNREDEIMDSRANLEGLKKIGWIPKYNLDSALNKILENSKPVN